MVLYFIIGIMIRYCFTIIFAGVVFNEMKGVFADSQTIFGEALLNSILPSNTYGHVSGGLPEKIPGYQN